MMVVTTLEVIRDAIFIHLKVPIQSVKTAKEKAN
jgi:hypothetical protein